MKKESSVFLFRHLTEMSDKQVQNFPFLFNVIYLPEIRQTSC